MPKSVYPGLQLRIFGAENARGQIIQWRTTTQERILSVMESSIGPATEMMREEMKAAYPWGGKTAQSIQGEAFQSYTGPGVRISINAYRELKYMTTLLADSDYRPFPYVIEAVNADRLVFYWQRFKRWVVAKRVMHPGFGRQGDVLRDSGTAALALIGQNVEMAVRSAVAEIHAGGSVYSVSRRIGRG